jgi:phosphoserine phosphatase
MMQAEVRSGPIKRTRVVLVRHGQSTYNAEKRHQGCSDRSTLTEKGAQMAHQTGLFLHLLNIDAVYSSPLKRAYQTAQQMLMTLPNGDSLPLHTSDLLQEIDLPAWEGLPYQVVRERFADDYRHWKEQPHMFQTVLDLYERASRFWETVIPRHSDQTLLVVSHSGAIRALISTALNLAPNYYHQLQQSNCGVSILNFSSWNPLAHSVQLEMMNSTVHLGEILPKLKEGRQGLRLLLLPCGESTSAQAEQAHLLQSVSIDFVLTSNLVGCRALTEQILQPCSGVKCQLVENIVQDWQGAISKRYPQGVAPHIASATAASTANPSSLTTGLIIAPPLSLRQIIEQALELKPGQADPLQLSHNALSTLHYPNGDRLPILQALNFSSSLH